VTTVAIIGAGPLGRWLALGAARAGFRVLLEDVMPANLHHARESIRQELGPDALPAVRHGGVVGFVVTKPRVDGRESSHASVEIDLNLDWLLRQLRKVALGCREGDQHGQTDEDTKDKEKRFAHLI
jgi:hypothetical protein